MVSPRWVVLDDTDPSINYTGTWFKDFGGQDNVGNYGPPYLRTLHGTSFNGTVELEFNGTTIEVFGTNIVKDANTNPDPTFECFVDDISIGRDSPFEFGENNWRFCAKTQLLDTLHKLRIDVQVTLKSQTFWLDWLRYIPSPNFPLDNKVIQIDNVDPAIQYDSQWTSLADIANMTTQKNSVAQVNFVGTSVSWVAFVPTELPHAGATGTWAIDGGKATQFLLPGLPTNTSASLYNQLYFTTPEVEVGPHTLTVTFLGDDQTTPLCIDHLYVKNGTFFTPTNNSTITPDQNPHDTPTINRTITPTPNSDEDHGKAHSWSHISAILGGTLGVFGFLVIITGIVLFWRRRWARQKGRFDLEEESESISTPSDFFRDHGPNLIAQIRRPRPYTTPHIPAPEVALTPEQQQSRQARKQREGHGQAVAHRHSNNEDGQTEPVSALSSEAALQVVTAERSAVRQHMDSGIRLGEQSVVDIPPHYTPE